MTSERDLCYYTPFNLALIIKNRNMSSEEADDFLYWVEKFDGEYLQPQYRGNPKGLSMATMDYVHYLYDKKDVREDRSQVARDFESLGMKANENEFYFATNDPYHFLKGLRLRILYFNSDHRARTTLRMILEHCGYRRRSHRIIDEIEEALSAFELAMVEPKNNRGLFDVGLDDRITFEVAGRSTREF